MSDPANLHHHDERNQVIWEERWHPLREEWVIIAADRQDRPWKGEKVKREEEEELPEYAPDCHLCPGNRPIRRGGWGLQPAPALSDLCH